MRLTEWAEKHRKFTNRILLLFGVLAGVLLCLILADVVAKESVQRVLGMNRPTPSAVECATAYALEEETFDTDDHLVFGLRAVVFTLPGDISSSAAALIRGVDKANSIFYDAGITFVIDTIEIIFDPDLPYNIKNYKQIARKYDNPGVINVYIFPNFPAFTDDELHEGQVDFHGAAVRIPSQALAIKSFYLDRTTLAHELGHCLGLFHIFEPDPVAEGLNLYSGDYVCDTKYFDQSDFTDITKDCEYLGKALKSYTDKEIKQLVCNIMGYSYDPCREGLTEGQRERLRWVVQQSPRLMTAVRVQ